MILVIYDMDVSFADVFRGIFPSMSEFLGAKNICEFKTGAQKIPT